MSIGEPAATDAPAFSGVSVAGEIAPDGSIGRDGAATDFSRAGTDAHVADAGAGQGQADAAGTDVGDTGFVPDPSRFAEIKAECSYCGRPLEPDLSP